MDNWLDSDVITDLFPDPAAMDRNIVVWKLIHICLSYFQIRSDLLNQEECGILSHVINAYFQVMVE